MGSDSTGRKEVIGLTDGYRESEASWLERLEQHTEQGFVVPPEVVVGDASGRPSLSTGQQRGTSVAGYTKQPMCSTKYLRPYSLK